MKKEFKRFEDYLRSQELKMTRTRELIFREIFSSPAVHPNAYDIHRRLQAKRKDVSLATIYRTLKLLVKSGLVSEIDLGEDHSHYEPERNKMVHGHLICLSCGKVQEFSDREVQESIDKVGAEKGYALDKFSIQVFGFCQKCKKN